MWVSGASKINGEYQLATPHSSIPLIAAVTQNSIVQIFDDEGAELAYSLKKDVLPLKLAWHPTKKQLVIAYIGGTIGLWCVDMEGVVREGKIHHCNITCLEWNSHGTRIVTGDEDGEVVVWKVDSRGKLFTASQYRLKGEISCCVFRNVSSPASDQRSRDTPLFFIAGKSGSIYYADDSSHCQEVTSISNSIHSLYIDEEKDAVCCLSDDLTLARFKMSPEGKMSLESSMKLSAGLKGIGNTMHASWIEPSVLAFTVNGSPIKLWDSANEDMQILDDPAFKISEYRSFQYNARKQVMAVGSENGIVVLWQSHVSLKDGEVSRIWKPINKIDLDGTIIKLSWGLSESILVANSQYKFNIINEQNLASAAFGRFVIAIQTSSNTLEIQRPDKPNWKIESKNKIRTVEVCKEAAAVFTGKMIEIYKYDETAQEIPPLIACDSNLFAINSKFVALVDQNRLDMFNYQGASKGSIMMTPGEGDITHLHSAGSFIAMLTRNMSLKIFDISGREPRLAQSRMLNNSGFSNEMISSFKINSDGSWVCFTVVNFVSCIFVYSVDLDKFIEESFEGYKISNYFWDFEDGRVLVCQLSPGSEPSDKDKIMPIFVTNNTLLTKKELESVPDKSEKLIAVSLPKFVYLKKQEINSELSSLVILTSGKEYVGVETEPPYVIKSITDFSLNLAVGNVDEALKSIKLIKNEGVWENMAKICAKLGRTRLAKLCMGKLRNAKSLRTLSYGAFLGEVYDQEAQAPLIATHLGLYDEATALCIGASRYDILSDIHCCAGKWEKAIEVAASKDRAALPMIFFKFARDLQESGDRNGAIAAFEKANATKTHVPRMLLTQPEDLKVYVDNSDDASLKIWWGQNAESHGDLDGALKYYTIANDALSIVRVYCLMGKLKEAERVAADNPRNTSVAFYLGRFFEEAGKVKEAIAYYSRTGFFGSAIRLAKEHKIDQELMHLALQSSKEYMNDVAKYFESKEEFQKAVTLYVRTGNVSKAMEICFSTKDTSLVETIAETLDADRDGTILEKAAVFLADNGSIQSAVKLLLIAQKFEEAFELCATHKLKLSEELVDKIQFDKDMPEARAKTVNLRLADLCFAQGLYQVACKRYTLAGDRLRAMGSLLKSGDKEKIIFFANVSGSKNPEIYVIAANFLQSLDWRSDPSVMKAIIQFYSKARSYAALGRFYESCALIEVDEFQNYSKALGAYMEAEKCFDKIKGPSLSERDSVELIRKKIKYIQDFLQIYQLINAQNYDEAELHGEKLLKEPNIDEFVRSGDIYSLLIETNYNRGEFEKARSQLAVLARKLKNVRVDYFVDKAIVQALGGIQEIEQVGEVEEDY